MHSSRTKLVLPTIDTCRWRRAPVGTEAAACGIVASLIGTSSGELVAVSDDACAACCKTFPPTTRTLNTVVASLVHRAVSRLQSMGGAAEHGPDAAARVKALAQDALESQLPARLRLTPARGTVDCAWQGSPVASESAVRDDPVYSCEHLDHDLASPSRCRFCHDWARERPISRPLALEELVPLPDRRCGTPVTRWAVAVTTAPRRQSTLEACLDGVVRAGWKAPRLFLDGTLDVPSRYAHLPTGWREDSIGAWPAWYLALAELVVQEPDADVYMMLQDDVVLHDRGPLRDYLERVLWPGDRPGLVNLFYAGTSADRGWHPQSGGWNWGAQAFLFTPTLARSLLADPGAMKALLTASVDHHIPIPTVIFEWAQRQEIDCWYTVPSLLQHIGNASAIWDNDAAARAGVEPPGSAEASKMPSPSRSRWPIFPRSLSRAKARISMNTPAGSNAAATGCGNRRSSSAGSAAMSATSCRG